ncbi:MAG: topoisomerase-4 subunit A [Parvicella sp.]|jgi:topoisomerase-4 subunit A
MSKDEEYNDNEEEFEGTDEPGQEDHIIPVSGMYREWFLDYASYVILERAVPALADGLKPVQRRILHSLNELDDGRYNKVANVIGNTMKYHPHGDQSIGDAMVQIGQKDLLIDCQGNWGNTLTGDGAAAPRYIEARLTKFGNQVVFNPKTTQWRKSYDGRNNEPIHLPVKFPLLLAQGAEGIAVGLACKMLPHNFVELIDASIDYLRGRKVEIFPDFPHGGKADFTNYNDGLRGGKVRVRANIKKVDSKTLMIDEIPFGTTTDSLIDSVVKANDKGKIKIKKIEDNTAANAEIVIHMSPGVSPDKTIDALYAFTNCEISISPNAVVIEDNKPKFLGASTMLKLSTDRTVDLLKMELEIKLGELENQWHWSSLERIFIEKRIYRDIEEEETWEGVISAIDKGLKPHVKHLKRPITEDDIVRLTEIKIKRISKFDSFKADDLIARIEENIAAVQNNLDNLIQYAVDYFRELKDKYGEGRERKTEIRVFDSISATKVIVSNKKLYVNREEGFIGWSQRKDEYISDCSEIDDIIIFFETGKLMVTKVADKKFVGKGIIHVNVWKKGDKRTIYHMLYEDGKGGATYMKRFNVSSITRDKEYDLTAGNKGSKLHYFSANPNGRREVVTVRLRPRPHLKKAKFDIDFGELIIKGRASKGNRATKEIISKVEQKEIGGSTLAARKVWWDEVVRRLNDEGRGKLLGEFKGDDKILTLHQSGNYKLSGFELNTKFDDDLIHIEKWVQDRPISVVYWNGDKEMYFVKRFLAESSSKRVLMIPEEEGSELVVASTQFMPKIRIEYNKRLRETKNLPDKIEELNELIDVKGLKAQGNQLTKLKVKEIVLLDTKDGEEWPIAEIEEVDEIDEEVESEENDEFTDENTDAETTSEEETNIDEEVDEVEVKMTPVKDAAPVEVEWDVTPSSKDKKEDEDQKEEKSDDEDSLPPKKNKNNPIKDTDDDDEGQITLF